MGKKSSAIKYDVIAIGSGVAGSNGALLATQTGRSVALIESGQLGGASANYSDIPISVFARAANTFEIAKNASRLGLRAETISYNFPSIKLFKDHAIKASQVTSPAFYEKRGVNVIRGHAQFINQQTVSVGGKHYSASKFIVATGAKWRLPKISGLDKVKYFTPDTLINIPRPPRSLFVIGGDKAGIEVAQIMASFGTKVFITSIAARLLPDYDEEVGDFIEKTITSKNNMIVSTSSRVTSIVRDQRGWRVKFNHAGLDKEVIVEQILVASDKEPATDMGLENAGVEYDSSGIKVNKQLQTSNRNIFACGAVINPRSEGSHIANYESGVVVSNMLRLAKSTEVDYHLMPRIIKTTPTIASVGLTEDDCNRQSIDHRTAFANLREAPYSLVAPEETGFIKLVANPKQQIIGATVVSQQAETVIHELMMIIHAGLTAKELINLPRTFLSANELIAIAAEKLL
ncbi:MAG: dihydrolipoyl dehydrogenase family protein [Candidatus Nanosyncoccaceae bacterium]|jgi:pyruvate/2-oxoglutarate dehydrogenase complex dihydrolipoamide dehydrogenase (E3) component